MVEGLVGGLRWRLHVRVFTDVVCGCAEEQPGHEYHPQATVALHQLSEEHRGNLVNRAQSLACLVFFVLLCSCLQQFSETWLKSLQTPVQSLRLSLLTLVSVFRTP